MIRLSIAILGIILLSGCSITGEPRSENVVFDGEEYTIQNDKLRDSISVGEVSGFPGTSSFWLAGKLASNFSDESFEKVLVSSLENANLSGKGYTLNANLVDSGNWSELTGTSLGTNNRKILINYTLENENIIFEKTIESKVDITNYNPLAPHYLTQRKAAEKSYAENISLLIEELKNFKANQFNKESQSSMIGFLFKN